MVETLRLDELILVFCPQRSGITGADGASRGNLEELVPEFDLRFHVRSSVPLVQNPMVVVFLKANTNPEQVAHSALPSFKMGSSHFLG